jgi:hypothetical protein
MNHHFERTDVSSATYKLVLGCGSAMLIHSLLRLRSRNNGPQSNKPLTRSGELRVETPKKSANPPTTPGDVDCIGTPSRHVNSATGQDLSDIEAKILIAARMTARAYSKPASEHALMMRLFQKCQDKTNRIELLESLQTSLLERPDLVIVRAANMGRYMCDGGTLLHTASRAGNMGAIDILLKQDGISPWDRDLQGRVALHWAAENWHVEACRVLLAAMQSSSESDVNDLRGTNAPVDLLGQTPLGWACMGSGRRAGQPKPPQALIDLLFAAGDGSIMPPTPYQSRSGSRLPFSSVYDCHHYNVCANGLMLVGVADVWLPRPCLCPRLCLGRGSRLQGQGEGEGPAV